MRTVNRFRFVTLGIISVFVVAFYGFLGSVYASPGYVPSTLTNTAVARTSTARAVLTSTAAYYLTLTPNTPTPSVTPSPVNTSTPVDTATPVNTAVPFSSATATPTDWLAFGVPTSSLSFDCPFIPPLGWGSVTPAADWVAVCGQCLNTPTPFFLPSSTPSATLVPGVTPSATPSATPALVGRTVLTCTLQEGGFPCPVETVSYIGSRLGYSDVAIPVLKEHRVVLDVVRGGSFVVTVPAWDFIYRNARQLTSVNLTFYGVVRVNGAVVFTMASDTVSVSPDSSYVINYLPVDMVLFLSDGDTLDIHYSTYISAAGYNYGSWVELPVSVLGSEGVPSESYCAAVVGENVASGLWSNTSTGLNFGGVVSRSCNDIGGFALADYLPDISWFPFFNLDFLYSVAIPLYRVCLEYREFSLKLLGFFVPVWQFFQVVVFVGIVNNLLGGWRSGSGLLKDISTRSSRSSASNREMERDRIYGRRRR